MAANSSLPCKTSAFRSFSVPPLRLAALLIGMGIAWAAALPCAAQADAAWGYEVVGAPAAACRGYTGQSISIALIDSGVDEKVLNAPVEKLSLLEDDGADSCGHGTMVAGLLVGGQANGQALPGVAPGARLICLKVFSGPGEASIQNVADAIDLAVEQGAQILNLSLGTPTDYRVIRQAVARAQEAGCLVVAAAGDFGGNTPVYPAAYPGVVGVGAVDTLKNRCWFSQYNGQRATNLLLCAPGEGIWNGGYRDMPDSGTSFSCAYVTGALALALEGGLEPSQSLALVLDTAQPSAGDQAQLEYGAGLVDLDALTAALPPKASVSGGQAAPLAQKTCLQATFVSLFLLAGLSAWMLWRQRQESKPAC